MLEEQSNVQAPSALPSVCMVLSMGQSSSAAYHSCEMVRYFVTSVMYNSQKLIRELRSSTIERKKLRVFFIEKHLLIELYIIRKVL